MLLYADVRAKLVNGIGDATLERKGKRASLTSWFILSTTTTSTTTTTTTTTSEHPLRRVLEGRVEPVHSPINGRFISSGCGVIKTFAVADRKVERRRGRWREKSKRTLYFFYKHAVYKHT